jgi:hypothetical protein
VVRREMAPALPSPSVAGICIFSDGTGPLKGFSARVDVSFTGGADYTWNGSYHFNSDEE